jgi:hypothetical protein
MHSNNTYMNIIVYIANIHQLKYNLATQINILNVLS